MSLFGWGEPKRFVSADALERNLKNQLAMTPRTLAELERLGAAPGSSLRVEYFFYSNTFQKARRLARTLEARGYSVRAEESAHDKKTYVVTGWTLPLLMSESILLKWTEEMVRIGFEHDCDFDGWGTNPVQDQGA